MDAGHRTPVRRRTAGALAPLLGAEPDRAAPDAPPAEAGGGGLLSALYALGGWLVEEADDRTDEAPGPLAALETMGTWALRAAMLNTSHCLPLPPAAPCSPAGGGAPQCSGAGDAAAAPGTSPMRPRASSGSGADVAARRGADAAAKQQHAAGSKPLAASAGTQTDDQGGPAAPGAHVSDVGGGEAAMAAELVRLRCEARCLRACAGSLFAACQSLQQENERLRASDGEELLGGALQCLLAEKSSLTQRAERLQRHNTQLLERVALLELTAASGRGSPGGSTADSAEWRGSPLPRAPTAAGPACDQAAGAAVAEALEQLPAGGSEGAWGGTAVRAGMPALEGGLSVRAGGS
ncbi:hypothetical protein HT031_006739 [Scenedesmus sp. PABB004]|nr:hypothetical protein HT031_006739 [Scenedesmus sp. PABB004]